MKILHLISGGDTGGAKTHVLSLVKELSKYLQVKLVCFIEDEFYREGKQLGIDIEVIKQDKRYDLSIIKQLKNKIYEENYDIVHCHGARANFVGVLLKRLINKPFITTIHSDYRLDFKDSFYKRIVYTSINSMSLRFFDYYIAISSNFKNMLINRGFKEKKIFTVYNGIDLKNELMITSKEEFLGNYNIGYKNKKIVGIMGRLDLVKNHEVFLQAAYSILKNRDDVIFLIAGDGYERERLIKMSRDLGIENKVHFLGFVKEPYSFFNAIDINVLTSKSESFPYVILEGARLKKPVISTNVGGIGDLVEHGVNGYLFNIGSAKELTKYLNLMVENITEARQMGEKLYKKVEEEFSLENMASNHYDIYKNIKKQEVIK
ncbi:glycosyltransferase family 4 protein [Caldisalinibacter kiritimatiensis]|uniref:Poly(Glycerol-phosphate) alpha-glucosyltransferase n=1 Tax=Caldisalinibacter kiritimatiensis TaxID=1304284 RepID=R1ASB3_9FIRM|nr:glycosyltransferase family 4 protein [Caldisalinibacter kiritimatiensis]EOC99536.1 Poly(glycerol-phosphate) alpha-glucosyltransferase [Caldisalinibacter kiritimatiensis]